MKRVSGLLLLFCCVVLGACQIVQEGHRDVYVDRALRDCEETDRTLDCMKYFVLDRIQRLAVDPSIGANLWGKVSIVPTYQPPKKTVEDPKTPELQPRSTESEFEQLYGFASRQLERFASTHALSWSSDGGDSPGDAQEGRGKKKKQALSLLQLLMFLKLKALTVAILVMVAFIKKILLAGAFYVFLKTLYLKTEHHSTGVEILHYPQTEHSWPDYLKQHGGGGGEYGGQQESYRHYEQRRGALRVRRDVRVKGTRRTVAG